MTTTKMKTKFSFEEEKRELIVEGQRLDEKTWNAVKAEVPNFSPSNLVAIKFQKCNLSTTELYQLLRELNDTNVHFDDCTLGNVANQHSEKAEQRSAERDAEKSLDTTISDNVVNAGNENSSTIVLDCVSLNRLEFKDCDFSEFKELKIERSHISFLKLEECIISDKIELQSLNTTTLEIKGATFCSTGKKRDKKKFEIILKNCDIINFSFDHSTEPTDLIPLIEHDKEFMGRKVKIQIKGRKAPNTSITNVPFQVILKCENSSFDFLNLNRNAFVEAELTNCEIGDFEAKKLERPTKGSDASKGNDIISSIKRSLKFEHCHFLNDLDLTGLGISKNDEVTLDLSYSTINGKFGMPNLIEPTNEQTDLSKSKINLSYTTCKILDDTYHSWPNANNCASFKVFLKGFQYQYLTNPNFENSAPNCEEDKNIVVRSLIDLAQIFWGFSNATISNRIKVMFNNQHVNHKFTPEHFNVQCGNSNTFARRPKNKQPAFNSFGWHVLQTALTNMGMSPEAEDLSIKRRLAQREDASLTEKLTSRLFELSANFGYNPFRAIFWFFLMLFLFSLINYLREETSMHQLFLHTECTLEPQLPYIEAAYDYNMIHTGKCEKISISELIGVGFDWMIPVFDLGFEKHWKINQLSTDAVLTNYIFTLFRLIGGYLIGIMLLSFSGYLNRDK